MQNKENGFFVKEKGYYMSALMYRDLLLPKTATSRESPTGRAGHGARGKRCGDGRPGAGHGGCAVDGMRRTIWLP